MWKNEIKSEGRKKKKTVVGTSEGGWGGYKERG
jgi:hypothetical protein